MNEKSVTFPVFYIHRLLDLAKESGGNVRHWFSEKGIPQTDENQTVILSWSDFRELLLEVDGVLGEIPLGLAMGQRLPINTHGNIGYAAINSSTIRDTVNLLKTYLPLRTDLLNMEAIEEKDHLKIVFEERFPLDDISRIIIQAILLAIKNVFDFITIGNSEVNVVAFPFAKGKDDDFVCTAFNCKVIYEQDWTGFSLPLDKVDTPLKMANPASFNEALRVCNAELYKLSSLNSFAGEVRKLILKSGSIPSLDLIAQQLYLTPRTLHRRLQAEDTSYKKIVEDIRHTLAVKYLENGTMTIQEIAYALNYSDSANFRRAFKRWEGMPPSCFQSH